MKEETQEAAADPAVADPGDLAVTDPGDPAVEDPGDPAVEDPADPAVAHQAVVIQAEDPEPVAPGKHSWKTGSWPQDSPH